VEQAKEAPVAEFAGEQRSNPVTHEQIDELMRRIETIQLRLQTFPKSGRGNNCVSVNYVTAEYTTKISSLSTQRCFLEGF